VTYLGADGVAREVRLSAGETLLDGALDNHIPGIIGQCGGGCTCATCHCFVIDEWIERLPPPHPDEVELLGYVPDRVPSSRLACQVVVDDSLDGLTVRVPAEQL
jgi:2Fe-2S ferredoxin